MEKTVDELKNELEHFKQSMNDWMLYLNERDKMCKEHIQILERRLAKMEMDRQIG